MDTLPRDQTDITGSVSDLRRYEALSLSSFTLGFLCVAFVVAWQYGVFYPQALDLENIIVAGVGGVGIILGHIALYRALRPETTHYLWPSIAGLIVNYSLVTTFVIRPLFGWLVPYPGLI